MFWFHWRARINLEAVISESLQQVFQDIYWTLLTQWKHLPILSNHFRLQFHLLNNNMREFITYWSVISAKEAHPISKIYFITWTNFFSYVNSYLSFGWILDRKLYQFKNMKEGFRQLFVLTQNKIKKKLKFS